MEKFCEPETITSLKALEDEFKKVYLIKDKGIIKTICATLIANKMNLDPVWLFVVAASGGGKTELLNSIQGIDFVHPIDTLTVNTFASGSMKKGGEASLLLRINNGVITFKDFTVILDMHKDSRKEIMGQLRAIFDGEFVKETGTGDNIKWRGKLGMVAAVTTIIHQRASEFSSMGERFIQYAVEQPDRRKVQEKIFENSYGMKEKREHVQKCMTNYINYVLDILDDVEIDLASDLKKELMEIADLTTQARSAVERSLRTGKVTFVPDAEMPTRVLGQLITIASAFVAINKADQGGKIKGAPEDRFTDFDRDILYKISLDSIPRKRRQVLQILAKYILGSTAQGIAEQMKLPTSTITEVLEELHALNFCRLTRTGSVEKWHIEPKYKDIITHFENITVIDEELDTTNEGAYGYDEEDW